MLKTNWI